MRQALHALVLFALGCLATVLVSCSSPSSAAAAAGRPQVPVPPSNAAQPYRISPGDVLKFEFANHPEYTRGVTVRPDAMVTLPLIGDVKAGGLQPAELAGKVTARYRPVLRYPRVTVELVSSPNQIVYVGGEVKTPGIYQVRPGKTALQTIYEAGGPTDQAAKQQAFLIRDQGTPEPLYVALDLATLHTGFELQPKDVLVVPKSGISTANQFVDQYINKLIPFTKTLGVSYFIGSGLE